MKLPNRTNAIIEPDKIIKYLLNVSHRRGGSKARLFANFGYNVLRWEELENDIRKYHLNEDVTMVQETDYGIRYEISAPLQTPNGRRLFVRSIWQIDFETDVPRLITLIPA